MPESNNVQSILDAAEQAAIAGDIGAAEPLLRQALQLQETQLGPHHPDLANTLNNLGVVCEQTGRPDEAEGFYRRAYQIAAAAFDADHPFVTTSRKNLADLCEARGRPIEAPLAPAAAAPAASPPPAMPPLPVAPPPQAISAPTAVSPPAVARTIGKHAPSAAKQPAGPVAISRPLVVALIAVLVIAVISVTLMRRSNGPGASTLPDASPAAQAPAASVNQPDAAPNAAAPVAGDPGAPPKAASPPSTTPAGDSKPEAGARSTRSPAQLMVAEAQVCRRFSTTTSPTWRCEEAGSSVAPGSLVYYTRIKAAKATTVEHRWYHGDDLQQRVELDVAANPSAGYRTYSRLAVTAAGRWRVEVRTTDGSVLHEARFNVR